MATQKPALRRPRLKKKRAGRYHHGSLSQTLIHAAAQMASRDGGVAAIEMRPLAKAAGVSPGAPFQHFENRDALLVAVAEEGLRRQLTYVNAAAEGITDPVEQQRAYAVGYVRFAVEEPGYFRVMHQMSVIRQSPQLQELRAASEAAMDATLGANALTPEIAGRTSGALAAQALVYGLARMAVDGLLGDHVESERAARLVYELTGVLGRGLGNSKTTKTR